jgi:predicted ATPase
LEFVHEKSLFPEVEYVFKHALIQEVTYQSLLQKRRRAIHARVVTAIEQNYSERLTEHLEKLAYHATNGEMWEKAIKYSRESSAKAIGRSAHREAVRFLEQALSEVKQLPDGRKKSEVSIDLRLEMRTALIQHILEKLRWIFITY